MYLHEFQAKSLLREYGLPVPDGGVASTASDALRVATELKGDKWILKAQVHTGGRGKAGGVKVVNSLSEVFDESSKILGMRLVTQQTGANGRIVRKLLVERAADIAQEIYFSIMIDRDTEEHILIVSPQGGMDIESLAGTHPEAIFKVAIPSSKPLSLFNGRQIAKKIGLRGALINRFSRVAAKLHQVFISNDCELVEINPMIIGTDEHIVCLDAKIIVDDNALYRHPKIEEMKDYGEMEALEVRAAIFRISYVSMEGNIGCMVNGAGLAMATMDIIKYYGGMPANFLDVGGGADENKVREAFSIILADPNVKVILINIFGGIVRCDVIAKGILKAAAEVPSDKHVVVRLDGTNVEEGKKLVIEKAKTSSLNIHIVDTMAEAAELAVQLAATPGKDGKK